MLLLHEEDDFLAIINSSPLYKMVAILADDNFKCIFFNENDRIPIQISLKFVPNGSIDNEPALVQVIALRQTGNKPLFSQSTMLVNNHYLNQCWPDFTDPYMQH